MKYNKVYYYDKKGIRQEFLAKNLDTKESIAALKEYEIWDDTESILLIPIDFVDHKTRNSFFRAKPGQTSNRIIEKNESDKHDLKVFEIFDNLLNNTNFKIWYKDFNNYPSENKTLINLQSYQWNFEVTREVCGLQKMARFDIYGSSLNGTLSPKRPEIIIEIIDTHFLDKDLFVSLIKKSKQLSTLIIFYFVNNETLYNKINQNNLRISAFIKDGSFFYGGILIKEYKTDIQEKIENKYLYFNQINQNIIKIIQKGKKPNIKSLKKENKR